MRPVLFILFCTATSLFSQPNPDIFLMDISLDGPTMNISNFRNISNNPGYDSQPSFADNTSILYAGTENGQTEIQLYSLDSKTKKRLNAPTSGGEYSPQKFPTTNQVAAVRLDPNGLQRLYGYPYPNESKIQPTLLLPEAEIAYYAFHDTERIIASILGGNQLNLVVANLLTKEVNLYIENSGRSIHNVPNSNSVSYTLVNEDKNLDVYLLNIDEDGESYFVCQLPIGIEDHCWISDSKLLLGSGAKLYQYDLFGKQEWEEIADLSAYHISDITRITVSANQKHLALVANSTIKTPSEIVSAHIDPFNKRDLDGFANAFSEDVLVGYFQKDTTNVGRKSLKSSYERFYKRIKNSSVEVQNRIVIGDIVIDHELATTNGEKENQATIYTTKNGLITAMFFIPNTKSKQNPSSVVDRQLEAYNKRDIDAFAATYSDDVVLMNYPNSRNSQGLEDLKKSYGAFFQNTPDLQCKISNRIVIGNKVIDKEEVLMNGQTITAVAIYEVINGKISSVTFVR